MIVVTGGAGHIGTNLALDLLASGEAVTVVDLRDPMTARGTAQSGSMPTSAILTPCGGPSRGDTSTTWPR